MTDIESIKRKIEALLAKANDTASTKARATKAKVTSADAYNRGREHGSKVQLRRNLLT